MLKFQSKPGLVLKVEFRNDGRVKVDLSDYLCGPTFIMLIYCSKFNDFYHNFYFDMFFEIYHYMYVITHFNETAPVKM